MLTQENSNVSRYEFGIGENIKLFRTRRAVIPSREILMICPNSYMQAQKSKRLGGRIKEARRESALPFPAKFTLRKALLPQKSYSVIDLEFRQPPGFVKQNTSKCICRDAKLQGDFQ